MEWFLPTPDGRTLAVEDAGDRDGRPVMVHMGTPGGRRIYGRRTLADAERRQLRLISYDRPIPGVEAWFFDDEGHAVREPHIEEVHAWLVERSS